MWSLDQRVPPQGEQVHATQGAVRRVLQGVASCLQLLQSAKCLEVDIVRSVCVGGG